MIKNLLATTGDRGSTLGWEDPLEGEHGNPLQYSPRGQRSLSPGTEEPNGLQPTESRRVGHD